MPTSCCVVGCSKHNKIGEEMFFFFNSSRMLIVGKKFEKSELDNLVWRPSSLFVVLLSPFIKKERWYFLMVLTVYEFIFLLFWS